MSTSDYPTQNPSMVRHSLRRGAAEFHAIGSRYSRENYSVTPFSINNPQEGDQYVSPVCDEYIYSPTDGTQIGLAEAGSTFSLLGRKSVYLCPVGQSSTEVKCYLVEDTSKQQFLLPISTAVCGNINRSAEYVFDHELPRGRRKSTAFKPVIVPDGMWTTSEEASKATNYAEVFVLSDKPEVIIVNGEEVEVYSVISPQHRFAGYVLAEHLTETGAVADSKKKVRARLKPEDLV